MSKKETDKVSEKSSSKKSAKSKSADSKTAILNKDRNKLLIRLAVAIVILGAVGFGIYSYVQLQNVKKDPQSVVKQETEKLVKKLQKHIITPTDETPTVATITDTDKLKSQPFFDDAQNGDKIIIFSKAHKVMVYRESVDLLVNVGPLNTGAETSNATSVGIISVNGNNQQVQKTLDQKLAGKVSVAYSGDAKNKNAVQQTTVVDVSGKNPDLTKEIAGVLGGVVGNSLPAGETAPSNASIVIVSK